MKMRVSIRYEAGADASAADFQSAVRTAPLGQKRQQRCQQGGRGNNRAPFEELPKSDPLALAPNGDQP